MSLDVLPVTVTTTYVLDTATPLTNRQLAIVNRAALDTLAQSDGSTTQYFAYDGLGSRRNLLRPTRKPIA